MERDVCGGEFSEGPGLALLWSTKKNRAIDPARSSHGAFNCVLGFVLVSNSLRRGWMESCWAICREQKRVELNQGGT